MGTGRRGPLRYFAAEKPFDKSLTVERKGTILYVAAEVVRQIAILAQPAMPASAAKLLDLLAIPADGRSFASLGAKGRLKPGTRLHTRRRLPALRRSGRGGVGDRQLGRSAGTRQAGQGRQEGCRPREERQVAGRSLMLVDHHCHLDFPQFGPERAAVVERARAAGVGVLVTISVKVRRLPELLELCAPYANVYLRSAPTRIMPTARPTSRPTNW